MITDVITRLEAKIPTLAKRISGAAEFAELMRSNELPKQDVSAHVLPLGLQGQNADAAAGMFTQMFSESIGVVLVIKTYSATGGRDLPELRGLIDAVIKAIAGWGPTDDEIGVFHLSRGALVNMAAGTLVYQIDFNIQDQLRVTP